MSKSKLKKWFLISASVLVVILIIMAGGKNKKAVSVTAEDVTKRTVTEIIPANGKIKPVLEVKISPDVSGEIVELNFKEGDRIKKGDLIIKIKQDLYLTMRDRAEATLNSTRAQLTQLLAQYRQIEQNYERNKALFEKRAISEAEYENALSQYEVAKEQIKQSEFNVKSATAALNEAKENLVKTVIYAPMDGIISKLSVERGERVVGTSQMAGTEMLRIANFDEMEVLVDVNENDIIRVEPSDTAIIEVDAYPGRKFKGIVTQIANSAKNIGSALEQVTNFEVRVFILSDSYRDLLKEGVNPFRPGMSATVSIQTDRKENVLTIPLQSITTRTDLLSDSVRFSLSINESVEQVFVVKNDTIEVRRIKTGIQDLNNIEVTEGLAEKEKVVTGPYSAISKNLKRGSRVKIEKKDKIVDLKTEEPQR